MSGRPMAGELDALVTQLGAANSGHRDKAMRRLTELGESAIVGLLDRLRHGSPRVRYLIVRAFGQVEWGDLTGRGDVAEALLTALDDEHPPVRYRAARALEMFREPRVAPILLRWLDFDDDVARYRAMRGLTARVFRSDVIPAAIRSLDDRSARVRKAAIELLSAVRVADGETLDRVRNLLRLDPDDEVRRVAARFLGAHDRRYWLVVPELHGVLTSAESGRWARLGAIEGLTKQAAVRGFARMAGTEPGLVTTVTGLLDDGWGSIRYAAVETLAALGGPHVVRPLEAMAADVDDAVRARTLAALVSLGTPNATGLAHRAIASDPAFLVRETAAGLLARLGGASATVALRTALTDPSSVVRHAALQALVALDGRAALPDIRAAATDPSEWNRNHAARLLALFERG